MTFTPDICQIRGFYFPNHQMDNPLVEENQDEGVHARCLRRKGRRSRNISSNDQKFKELYCKFLSGKISWNILVHVRYRDNFQFDPVALAGDRGWKHF